MIRHFMAQNGYNTNSLAKAAGLQQSSVYRALIPNAGGVNGTHFALCAYADINPLREVHLYPEKNAVLMEALTEVWDGTDRHARVLARLLRAACDISHRARSRAPSRPRGRKRKR